MHILREPDLATAHALLASELQGLQSRRGHLIQLVGSCTVKYEGRASSELTDGERLVVLKPDGTLLVHGAARAKPLNWQPPGAAFATTLEDGRLVLTSHRLKPSEFVRIAFASMSLVAAVPMKDEAEFNLQGTEDELQALLFARPALIEPGFVPQKRERDSGRGFYDLDGRDARGRRLIVETKRESAGVSDAQQLWRYVEELRRGDPSVRGMLVARRVAAKARNLLQDHGLEWRELEWRETAPLERAGQANLGRFS